MSPMYPSTTVLAAGPSNGLVIIGTLSLGVAVVLAFFTIRHYRQTADSANRARVAGNASKDLDDVDSHLTELKRVLAKFAAEKPRAVDDFGQLPELQYLIEGCVDEPGVPSDQLQTVVDRCADYRQTGLQPAAADARDREEIQKAVEQERARGRLCKAVSSALQSVRDLQKP